MNSTPFRAGRTSATKEESEVKEKTPQERRARDRVPAPMLARIETYAAQWAARQRALGHEPSADLLYMIIDAVCREWIRSHCATGSNAQN